MVPITQAWYEVQASPEESGEEQWVEEAAAMTVEEAYERMLTSGALHTAMRIHQARGSAMGQARADALLEHAMAAPKYISDGEHHTLSKELGVVRDEFSGVSPGPPPESPAPKTAPTTDPSPEGDESNPKPPTASSG